MTYRTTCPQCASVFRLGTNQLDAAQGWVQCSVCGAAFDAYPSLLMEDGSPVPESIKPPADASPLAVETSTPDTTKPADAVAASQSAAPAQPSATGPVGETLSTDSPAGIANREASASLDLPSIIIMDPYHSADDDPGPLPEIPAARSASRAAPTPAQPPAHAPAPAAAARTAPARPQYTARPGTARVPSANRRVSPWVWGVVSLLLLLVLVAQSAYFLRDTLANQLPQSRPALERACAVLGCSLSLPKNLTLLQIVGSDLQTVSTGRLILTFTLGNRDNVAQTWPMLTLTLTDQRNNPVARRSFAPSEYLGDDDQRIAAGIPPRSEQPLSLPLNLDNVKATGFDLQLSY